MSSVKHQINTILQRKFSAVETEYLSKLIDERIREVAFELIKNNLRFSGVTNPFGKLIEPFGELNWNGYCLKYATYDKTTKTPRK